MTIKVYPSLSGGQPINTYDWTGTYAGFLTSRGLEYTEEHENTAVIALNGKVLSFCDWEIVEFTNTDLLEVKVNQHGGIFKGLGSIIGGVLGFALGWLLPSSKGLSYNAPEQGTKLETIQANANQSKLGDSVPEIAGRFRRYPDYLTPPRRYFASEREQVLQFLSCVGVGRYQINSDEVKIGNTPLSAIDGAHYEVKGPNESWGSNALAHFWHTTDEVGGTSSGTAGLELSTEIENRTNTEPSSYLFNGLTITRSGGRFPTAWGQGTLVSIKYPRQYIATNTTLTGFFGHSGIDVGGYFGEDWTAEVVENQEGGYYLLAFWRMETVEGPGDQPDTEEKRYLNFNPGTYTYDFAPTVKWTVESNDESSITLQSGSRFFEDNMTLSTSIKFEGGTVYGEWTNAYVATPAKEKTQLIEFDLFFPQGLCYLSDSGEIQNMTAGVEVQWRDINTGQTQSVLRSYTRATNDQIGFSELIAFDSPRQVSVRVRRVGAEATTTQEMDVVHWYGLKARLPIKNTYSNWTTIGLAVRSGGKLAAQSENQFNLVVTRILPTLRNGGSWDAPVPTRDISALIRYIALSIGYTDDNIDIEELTRLHQLWTNRGEKVDHIFDLTTVKEALNIAMGAGMAELTVANGQIRPVREGVRTQHEHVYSSQNMTKSLIRSFRAKRHDDHDGVEVEYVDSETWETKTIICALPSSKRLKLEKMKLRGVSNGVIAWRIGMRRLGELMYRRWEYGFDTEMDALNSEYGSYVALVGDTPGYGQSMVLEHIEPIGGGALLHVSEPLQWEDGKAHLVAYRKPDGKLAGPYSANKGIDEYSVIAVIPKPWPEITLQQELPHVYFGVVDSWSFPALVQEITPSGMDDVGVKAVNYDPRIYAYDDSFPEER